MFYDQLQNIINGVVSTLEKQIEDTNKIRYNRKMLLNEKINNKKMI